MMLILCRDIIAHMDFPQMANSEPCLFEPKTRTMARIVKGMGTTVLLLVFCTAINIYQ